MKRKVPPSSSSGFEGNFDQQNNGGRKVMEMIRSQKERRKKIKQQENSSGMFIVDTLLGIYSDKKNLSSSIGEVHDVFNQVTINLLSDLSKCENSLEIFREKIDKYIVHSNLYRDDVNFVNRFIVYHIYLAQEIFLCFLRSKNEVLIRDRLIEIGLKSILAFVNSNSNIIEYYFTRFFKFLNCDFIAKLSDRNVWTHMLSSTEILQFASKGIQRLFNVTNEGPLTLHMTTLSLLQESQIISIPNFLMTCSDYFIDNLVHRTILENHNFESYPNIIQHFDNVSYHCIWFLTFYDKKRDTSKLLKFVSNFRKLSQEEHLKPLMVWENLTNANTLSTPVPLKSYTLLLKSSRKIIDRSLFQAFVISEFYNLFQISEKLSSEELFQKNKDPIYLTIEPGTDKILDEAFQWNMDNLENFNEQLCDILKDLLSFQNLNFAVISNFINKMLKTQENSVLKLIDEIVLECINREDIPGCINCLIIGRNIYPIPKTMKPKTAVSNGNQHLSTIDQWMKDHFFIYLSSGGTNTGIERNTRQASFVTKLLEYIIPLENNLLLTLYQKILNNLVNSRHELVSTLLNKIKKVNQSENETNQDSTDSDYEEVKTILLEYEKYGENAYNTSSKSSILPLAYYPVMKKTRWCNVIVPQLLSFILRDCNDGVMKTKFEKLKSALISSLVNRKLIPKDMIQSENQKEDHQGVESSSSSLPLKVSLVEGCLLRVVSEIENQIKKQSTNIDSLLALFFECHTAITDINNIMNSESFDEKIRSSTQIKLVEIVLQSFYDCCMVMGSFSQHEGLLVTILSDGNSQVSETSSSQRKQNHLDWIVLFKVSVLMPLANVNTLIKDRLLKLLRNLSTAKETNSDLVFTMSVLLSSLITVSTNEVTIIQEFIELTNKGKENTAQNTLENGLQERMNLVKVCFSIWDEITPRNFVDSLVFAKLIISCLEVCHHMQNYNSDFGESFNVFECISHNVLEETFQKSIVDHFTSAQHRDNEFFCFIPAKMQRLYFWISSRYSLIFSQIDISSRKSEKVQQMLKLFKRDETNQVKNHLTNIHSSFNNEFIDNLFNGIQLLDFEEWSYLELNIQDDICHKVLSSYYRTQFLQYNTLLSSKTSQNSLPFMITTLFTQALAFNKECEHHSSMIQSLISLIPKFSSNDQFSNQDQFWLFEAWLQALQSSHGNSRKFLYDFVVFTEHLDPIIFYLGTYSLSIFSQDFDSNVRLLKNTLSQFSQSCLKPISHLHPWPVLFTSKILEGLFSLVAVSLTWISKRETSAKELTQLFRNFILETDMLKLNITRNLGLHVSSLESWIFNFFSNSKKNKEEILYKSKEILKDIISDLEKDYHFGLTFLSRESPAMLNTYLKKIDSNYGGLLISDMMISLFINPTASKYMDSFFELKEKAIGEQSASKISIHSQTILDYLNETKFSTINGTDTNRLSKIIELVFERISSLNANNNESVEKWVEFFHHLLRSIVIHYTSFIKQLEHSNTSAIPNSQINNIHEDIPKILETIIHQILVSNPVSFISIAEQAICGNISGLPQLDENTQQKAEYQALITIALIRIILANDEIIRCILNPDGIESPWYALTNSTEFQSILSQLLENINLVALHNEINVNSERVKLIRSTHTALNLVRKLIQKKLLSESAIEIE